MSVASDLTASSEPVSLPDARRTLVATGVNHALHDGYTDLIYVLLPVWQAEFGLGYAGLAVLRSLYYAAMGGLQIPADRLAARWPIRRIRRCCCLRARRPRWPRSSRARIRT